ncbi:hypothetical protein DE4585_03139 [Mycobacteroides salmoniphilum]|uniref:Uncharacterized protein n=1 Tax=Mycobacteroides salmoniphilum TaxID=404941 RepID=A0A4R8RXT7_9MYCO|nr:hypothetical protein DE4585_03139 [Mycobacteroides salmoniphilum]
MIELTAIRRFAITGRGEAAIIDGTQIGDRTIREGDHALIDGIEYVIRYIDSAPRVLDVESGVIPIGLVIGNPGEDPRAAYRPKPALRNASAIEPVARLSCWRPEFLPRFWFGRP